MKNRSLEVKFIRARKERIEAGMIEGSKSAYITNKTAQRETIARVLDLAEKAGVDITKVSNPRFAPKERAKLVKYQSPVRRDKSPVVLGCYADCNNELYRRA